MHPIISDKPSNLILITPESVRTKERVVVLARKKVEFLNYAS